MSRRVVSLAVVAVMLLMVVAGCDARTRSILLEVAREWAYEHGAKLARYSFTGNYGDDEVDAVMDIIPAITDIQEAETLMEEGRAEGDVGKMGRAVDKCPNYPTYRLYYGAALLKNGEAFAAQEQIKAGAIKAAGRGDDHARTYAQQGIDELSAVGVQWETEGFSSTSQCSVYYGTMASFYKMLVDIGESRDFSRQQYDKFVELALDCR